MTQAGFNQDALSTSAHGFLQDEYYYFLEFAATVIQRHFRGYLVRKAFYVQKSAERTQHEALKASQAIYWQQDCAARIIQLAWQSFRNRRIYQYYRDLIQFRERGDPREMLRAINPREANLIDAAAGIHVRFRLGGAMFPPLVFYKIFTHRSVADINAFGPRNYSAEVAPTAKEIHSQPRKQKKQFSGDFEMDTTLREYIRPDGTLGLRCTRGWYERVENNGWRPIAERMLLDEDPTATATRLKRMPHFHHNIAVRREERVRRAKQRKREWLRKMYAQDQPGGEGALPHLPGSCLADLADEELDAIQVDELLEWSQHLDFHSYVDDWTSMACTMGSESFQPQLDTATGVPLPAPSMSLSAALGAAGVAMQPFKGGATPAAGATSGLAVR